MYTYLPWVLLGLLFFVSPAKTWSPQFGSSAATDRRLNPLPSVDWLRRADDEMNIRLPGSRPFRLRATFHAYPGLDFAKPGKSEIITGDGTYEETWLSPERWRREVTFGSYHAVEIRADGMRTFQTTSGMRTFQTTSDYEPSRLLMLLDALLYPVPRLLLEPQLQKDPPLWTLRELSAGPLRYVQLRYVEDGGNGHSYPHSYNLTPQGILVRSDDEMAMMTSWQDDENFGGRIVPRLISVRAMDRELLTVRVSIQGVPAEPSQIVQIAGPTAELGLTLKPFHWNEVHRAKVLDPVMVFAPGNL